MPDYPENPGPLPSPDLKNKSDGGKGPLGRPDFCSKDPELVKQLQKMLVTLGYDLGTYGPEKDGMDGSFGKLTETAVNDFQEKNLDWEANQLKVDALVGPRTSDALNRAMVGRWYEHYQTPGELVDDKPLPYRDLRIPYPRPVNGIWDICECQGICCRFNPCHYRIHDTLPCTGTASHCG